MFNGSHPFPSYSVNRIIQTEEQAMRCECDSDIWQESAAPASNILYNLLMPPSILEKRVIFMKTSQCVTAP